MKKRVLSMILMVCMIVSLLVGFTVSAAAEAGIITYTLKDGDTVLKACQKNGIDFYAKQKLIATINNIVDYRSLPVGFTVKLPTDAYVASASTAAATSTAASSYAAAASGAATTANIAAGDSVSYYLIRYKMKSGDTVADVCNSLGVNFGTYSSMIKDINGIGSWNNVKAGSTILIPSATVPPVGTSCYAVVAHTVASGETATSICSSYGLSYGANEALLKAINNKSNLNNIMRGSSFLVPVSTTIKGTTATTTTSTAASSSSTSSSSTSSNSKTYSISGKIVGFDDGTGVTDVGADVSYEFLLNGKAVTKAAAGEKITVKSTNNKPKDYTVGGIVIYDSNKSVVKSLTNKDRTFVMPASDVKVYFNMISSTPFDIEKVASTGGKISTSVDGVTTSHAYAGKEVVVTATPDKGFELQRISYSTDPEFKKDVVVVKTGSFAMPKAKVYVKADFTKASAHEIYDITDSGAGGKLWFKVGGSKTTSAWGGYTVQIVAVPDSGKVLDTLTVTMHNQKTFTVDVDEDNCFIMPGYDVDVKATFKAPGFKIKTGASVFNGIVTYKVNGVTTSTAEEGEKVEVIVDPTPGYKAVGYYYEWIDTKDDNTKVSATYAMTAKFIMPESDVCVIVEFEKTAFEITEPSSTIGATYNGLLINGNSPASTPVEAVVGDQITVLADLDNKYTNSAYYIQKDDMDVGAYLDIPFNKPFYMPASDITILIESVSNAYSVSAGSISYGTVAFSDSNDENDGSCTSEYGETVTIKLNPNSDYEYIPDSLVIKNMYSYDITSDVVVDNDPSDGILSFKMPASSVTVTVKYRRQIHELPTLTATGFEYRVMIDGKLVKLNDAAVAAKFKDDKYATTDYGAGNGKFYYGNTIYVYYTGGTFDKDAWDFLGTDIYGNPYTTKNGIGTNANGYYFTFKENAVKPATIEIS